MSEITAREILKQICDLTVELTRLRQNEVKHLCIENYAPKLFGRLLREWNENKSRPRNPAMRCDSCGHVQTFSEVLVENGTADGICDRCNQQRTWRLITDYDCK